MGTRIIVGAVFTVLAFIGIAVCYLVTQYPRRPKWANETVIGSVVLPLVIGAMFMGPMLMGEGLLFNRESLGVSDIAVALSILAAGVVILLLMRIPKRVASLEALGSAAETEERREEGLKAGMSGSQPGTLKHGA